MPLNAKKKILVVDDEEVIVDILKRRFERIGFAVTTAVDGNEGIAQLKEEKFDLVICDVKMPKGSSGTDVLKTAQESNPSSPFVAISGHIMSDESVKVMMGNGASMFMKKPFPSLKEFTETVITLVDDSQ